MRHHVKIDLESLESGGRLNTATSATPGKESDGGRASTATTGTSGNESDSGQSALAGSTPAAQGTYGRAGFAGRQPPTHGRNRQHATGVRDAFDHVMQNLTTKMQQQKTQAHDDARARHLRMKDRVYQMQAAAAASAAAHTAVLQEQLAVMKQSAESAKVQADGTARLGEGLMALAESIRAMVSSKTP